MLYGLTMDRKQALNSQCNWKPFADGDTIKPTELYAGSDGRKIYVQLVFQFGETVQEVAITSAGSGLTLEGYGAPGDVVPHSEWADTEILYTPLVVVYSVEADGSALSSDIAYTVRR